MPLSMSLIAASNMNIYMFDGEGVGRGQFERKLLQVDREFIEEDDEYKLTASNVPAGKWDMALVTTPDNGGLGFISEPVHGHMRDESVMFRLMPQGGVLPQAPELYTGRVDGQTILPNVTNTAPHTTLSRNVAWVKVVIKDPKGFSVTGPGVAHKLTLGNIPTTLNWEGQLLPSPEEPTVSGPATGMTGEFTITNIDQYSQKCDTLYFMVPAHRGTNLETAVGHRMTVSVDLKMPSGDDYQRTGVEIPVAPKANEILVLTLIPTKARLDVQFAVTPWNYKQNDIIFE